MQKLVLGPAVVLASLLVGCGGPGKAVEIDTAAPVAAPEGPLSAEEHERAAVYHEQEEQRARADAEQALKDEAQRGPVQCFDKPVDAVGSSGGEGYRAQHNCWAPYDAPSAKFAAEARFHQEEAQRHRLRARSLRRDEQAACKTLSSTDPALFGGASNIVRVARHTEEGQLRGARVIFATQGGLTAQVVRERLACQVARAAVNGFRDATDPVALPGVDAVVMTAGNEIAVVVRAPAGTAAETVLARAQALAARK